MNRLLCLFALAAPLAAQATKSDVLARIDATKAAHDDIALKIWDYAEVGFRETRSSGLLQETLQRAGFRIEAGVAGIPTAFVATAGSGRPVIAILGEFDALPGVSQEAVPEKKERRGSAAGHACGHHLFGAGSAQAAVAVREWLQSAGRAGTLRYYGTPAEEGGSGKVYMVRAGLFQDVDVVLHWHASDRNQVQMASSLANRSGKFRFRGVAAHASGAPERGRSALDGVEAMNHMANLLREHVPDTTRIHYVITRGGEAPNVVPAFAEVYYYVRSPHRQILGDVWARIEDAARGAALGTGTKVEWEVTGGVYELLPNEALGRVMHTNLNAIGGVTYTPEERAFAAKIGQSVYGQAPAPEMAAVVTPFNPNPPREGGGSTDVGDVSWVVPTVGVRTATWAPGTPAHSWQAVACGGTSLGLKGMNVAAKTLAATMVDLFSDPAVIARAREEFERRRGAGFKYEPLIGNRPPALDYRD
ncbi:MAG: amidohydrolase [Verrucomicrobia bacterium]|nr:amidohydrolase [Verrucomicrobiota bacterium]